MPRPDLSRVPEFYHKYIQLVPGDNLLAALREQEISFLAFLNALPDEKWDHRYVEGKWSIRELVLHCLDAERVFAYRALCFARKDPTPLPSFDEEAYALHSKAANRSVESLKEEFSLLRKTTIILFEGFDEEQLEAAGTASGKSNYVRAFGFIIAGHLAHHKKVMRERYL